MARYSILSKPVLFTLPVITALFASAIPAPAQSGPEAIRPPLMVPYRPLMPATDGWLQEGVLMGKSVAAAGLNSWLTAQWYYSDPDNRYARKLTTLVRLIQPNIPASDPVFLPEEPWIASGYDNAVKTLTGIKGAWVIWPSLDGVKAWWISSLTGQPAGPPFLLPGGGGLTNVVVAGDGETGWVISQNHVGTSVAALTDRDGRPRLNGSTVFPFPNAQIWMAAARPGQLLVLRNTFIPPLVTGALMVDANAVVSSPQPWPDRSPNSSDIGYGLMPYGEGWLAVYSRQLTPLLPGRIVIGQELLPNGLPTPEPPQSLFVAPDLIDPPTTVLSSAGKGVIVTTNNIGGGAYTGYGMVLEKGNAPRLLPYLGYLNQSSQNGIYEAQKEPLTIALRGDQLAILRPEVVDEDGFTQTLNIHDIRPTPVPAPTTTRQVMPATGIQIEPALAWSGSNAVVTWRQMTTPWEKPGLRHRVYRTASELDDLMPGGTNLSSPDMAVYGSRILLVGRQESPDQDLNDIDDVAGIFIDNNRVTSTVFKIGYGPGSQRAACVAQYQEGFCVAWREEYEDPSHGYISRIRLSILDRNGLSTQPGGRTVASSSSELSSPCLAVNGNNILVVWKKQELLGTRVEAAIHSEYGTPFAMDVFPGRFTSSPEVLTSGAGFLITARGVSGQDANAILAAEYLAGTSAAIPLPPPTAGLLQGREPVAAALADGGTALFWLDHRKSNAPSTRIWMAVQPSFGVPFGPPVAIHSGLFDRDTLTVKGDGQGRVLLAVKSLEPQHLGVRVFLLAPGISEVPTLSLISGGSPGATELNLQWTPNVLFPSWSNIVESSRDLMDWSYAGSQLTYIASPDGFSYRVVPNVSGPQYFRLRAAFTGN